MKILFLFLWSLAVLSGLTEIVRARQTEQERAAQERQQQQRDRDNRDFERRNGADRVPSSSDAGVYYSGRRNNSGDPDFISLQQAIYLPLKPEEKARITPLSEDFTKYADFLKKPHTGLAKILPDPKCGSAFVIDIGKKECAGALPMVGRGAFFSFRLGRNFPSPYSDIHLIDGKFVTGSKTELGLISRLGDLELETITIVSPEIAPVRNFRVARTEAEIKDQELRVKRGLGVGGLIYSNRAEAELNQIYVVRSIAFRHAEQFFNDQRSDILVVFRLVRQHSDGAVTILWQRLEEKRSPRIYK